ncbi:helicase [Tepiditoga spiralis]|uniref:Helicase n=1 Tax=Tepiditoga spiralis TaxID=2108365 RepID=A0A7G1GA74_9BACT|nr:DEAD/DEAH box helicase [Tepiditoga spiralis]BBE31022.1 helicase [Tepiditoga spiralis]
MGKRIIFGKTWWGKKWVEAIKKIDMNTNRLPRGKTYANKKLVLEIKINKEFDIIAKVQGTRPKPYNEKISLKNFLTKEKNKIKELLNSRPDLSSQLIIGVMPEELLSILENEHIYLFPKSWKEIDSHCSCPDWANPCKHLAAVYYIIANEIDKDPFLIFEMHGLKKDELISFAKTNSNIQDKIFIPINTNEKIKEFKEPIVDFSSQIDNIIKMLPNETLFFNGNFNELLFNTVYETTINYIKNLKIKENKSTYFKDTSFKVIYSELNPIIKIKNNPFNKKSKLSFQDLYNNFESIPLTINNFDNEYSVFFKKILSFTYNLVLNKLFIPKPVSISNNEFYIKYNPLTYGLKEYIKYLISILPNNFIVTENESLTMKKDSSIEYIISLILKEIIKKACKDLTFDKLLNTFITDDIYNAEKFEEKQTFNALKNYFEPFYLKNIRYSLLIKIYPFIKDHYVMELYVQDKKDPLKEGIPLNKFLSLKKYEKFKIDIVKQIGFISSKSYDGAKILKNESVQITPKELSDFFTNTLPVLELFNVDIILPKEMKKILTPSAILQVKTDKNIKSYINLNELIKFEWKIALGDTTISYDEFLKLTKKSKGIIKFKDMYIKIEPEKLLKILKKIDEDININSQYELMSALLTEELNGIKLFFDDEVKKILENLKKPKNIRQPSSLNATLRTYQKKGYRWLYTNSENGFGCCLADDMGLGKTIQTISLLLKQKELKKLKSPALIICPTSLIGNWENELTKFAPLLKYHIYYGGARELKENVDVLITSYGLIRRDVENFKKINWSYIVIDEAQNIKNPNTKQTKSVKSLNGNKKIALTGTPIENKLLELWSIFDFLMPGYLGKNETFKNNVAKPIEKFNDISKMENLKKIITPFILRRLKTDKSIIKDLPEKIIFDQYVYLKPQQIALYKETLNLVDEILKSSGIEKKGMILKLITSLKQICNHPSQYLKSSEAESNDSGKTEKLISILNNILESNEKVLIFTQYKEMGIILEKLIKKELKTNSLFFYGSLSRKQRDQMVEDFQTKHQFPIMIISLKAGGTGLNLTNASHVIHYDLWWNPAVENQATDRAYRIGQKKNVIVHRMITKNTFEEKINEILKSKNELSKNILNFSEKWITEFSDKELKEIFKLKL